MIFVHSTKDSRYSANQTMTCTYDCEITAILTVFPPLCTDTGNKYSLYATNRKGNSTIKTTHYSVTIACKLRHLKVHWPLKPILNLMHRAKFVFFKNWSFKLKKGNLKLCKVGHRCFDLKHKIIWISFAKLYWWEKNSH